MTRINAATPQSVADAADILKRGGLIGLPTETVYGLGADATSGQAVAKIFAAKGRPSFNPLIIHVASVADAEALADFNDHARALAATIWPGPLTMILPRKENCPVSDLATAGLPTIAIRIPGLQTARDIIAAAGVPIAAPSANASGTLSPTNAQHVAESLGDAVELVIAAGASAVGLESTVLDLSDGTPIILRPGAVTPEDIARVIGITPAIDDGAHDTPKSPGQLLRHYAPRTPVRLNANDVQDGEALLAFGPTLLGRNLPPTQKKNLSEGSDLNEAASHLFGYLHDLDKGGFKSIAVMTIPDEGLGLAINDRLKRAAAAD